MTKTVKITWEDGNQETKTFPSEAALADYVDEMSWLLDEPHPDVEELARHYVKNA